MSTRIYKVYHFDGDKFPGGYLGNFKGSSHGMPQPQWPRDYYLVAEVSVPQDADPIDFCLEKTINIDGAWPDNPDVKAVTLKPRSSSCSDIVVGPDGLVSTFFLDWCKRASPPSSSGDGTSTRHFSIDEDGSVIVRDSAETPY